jgi:hypothetical protein
MESRRNSIKNFSIGKGANVQSAFETIQSSRRDSQSIIIIKMAKSGDYAVHTVTIESSDGTETQISLDGWPIISIEELVGMFLRE